MQSKSGTKSNKLDSGAASHLGTLRVCLNFLHANTCASFDPNLLRSAINRVCQKTSSGVCVGCVGWLDSQMSQSKELSWKQLKHYNDPSCAQGFCTMKEQRIEKSLCSIFNRPETNYLYTGHKFGEVLQEITSPNLWAPSCEVYTSNLYVWRLAVLSASGRWDTTKSSHILGGNYA